MKHTKKISTLAITSLLFLYAVKGFSAEYITVNSTPTITPVIELYTSEGCSSCPPADDFLSKLAKTIDDDFHAVPLVFHVDYWNYLGWKDPFSQSQFTKRQRWIGLVNKQSSIYTPEFVVGGKEALGGGQIVQYVEKANKKPSQVDIGFKAKRDGDNKLKLDIMFDNKVDGRNTEFHVALYENDLQRYVSAGENRGRTLKHNYVVRYWSPARRVDSGMSDEKLTVNLKKDWDKKNIGLAVVVVDRKNGRTLQSVHTRLDSLYSL